MNKLLNRRQILRGILLSTAIGGTVLASRRYIGPVRDIYDLTDSLNYNLHNFLLSNQPLVREFDKADVSVNFPTSGTVLPKDDDYQRFLGNDFADWSLSIDGLVENSLSLSLADLKNMKAQTQTTLHTCDEGWSAIGEWTGVPLASLLTLAGLKPGAKYIVFHCMDTFGSNQQRYYESIDLFSANHPQTILAYGLNGESLPVKNGAPLRLRVETQIGYKHAKYVGRVEVVDSLQNIGSGRGGWWEDYDHAPWYAGL
ncbi:MAG: molybdopterin-binding protein [SAR86 cluster bacterium]|uniref:Molybdopterin-binding protein n=1 Tax=SAR86 cluster bacterium TaxID=2030880 RepID=A0A2A5B7N1_9GAMM|nr:MAG: molybdopterin-binding protein [SAR86 cluster bacterium]